MNFVHSRRLLMLLSSISGLWFAGCSEPGSNGPLKQRMDSQSAAIREQYIKRENAMEASLDARRAYLPTRGTISSSLLSEFEQPVDAESASLAEIKSKLAQRIRANANWTTDPQNAEVCFQYLNQAILSGQKPGDEDYEQAVAWLLDIIDATGRFAERPGPMDQWMSLDEMLVNAALRASLLGDQRLKDQSFFAFLPLWTMHQLQPTDEQATMKAVTKSLAHQSQLYPSPAIQWWMENVPEPAIRLKRFDAVELPADYSPPPPFGFYPQAAVVFWRSSWAVDSGGLIADGALPQAPESALTAGHVSWTAHGDPVLVQGEEVFQSYPVDAKPDKSGQLSASLIPTGSVLRVGDNQPTPGRAPIIVRELNASGGNLRINASELFPQLNTWHRDLFWEAGGELRIIDNISYEFGHRDRTAIYWRLSASQPVNIETDRKRTIIEWGENAIVLQGNTPLEIDQFLVPVSAEDLTQQVVIRLQTIGRPHTLRLLTRVLPREDAPAEALASDQTPD